MFFFSQLSWIYNRIRKSEKPLYFIWSRILKKIKLQHFIKIKRKGYKIKYFPSIMSFYAFDGFEKNVYYRNAEESFLEKYLNKGDTVIDVGANIGLLTLKAASIVGEEGKVYSFEPTRLIYEFLGKNIKFNNFDNVKHYNYAIGEENGESFISDVNIDDSTNYVTTNGKTKILIRKLDSFFENNMRVNLLKVDVEGFELFVFRGAPFILRNTDCVFFESWATHFKRYGYAPQDIFKLLNEFGFNIYKLNNSDILKIPLNYESENCEDLIAVKNLDAFKIRYFSNSSVL